MDTVRIQWTVTKPSSAWVDRMAKTMGIRPSQLADRLVRYAAGQLSSDEVMAFEGVVMGPLAASAAKGLDWKVGRR